MKAERRNLALLLFCACGAANLLFYALLSEPLTLGKTSSLTYEAGVFQPPPLGEIGVRGRGAINAANEKRTEKFDVQTGSTDMTKSDLQNKLLLNSNIQRQRSSNAERIQVGLRRLKQEVIEDDRLASMIARQTDFGAFHFSYSPNSFEVCAGNVSLNMIIVVVSDIDNFDRRFVIRNTWGSYVLRPELKTRLVFLVGRGNSSDTQLQLEKESSLYGDVLQVNVTDSYRNLTMKSLALLQWVNAFCSSSKFVLKSDDDMFIHVPNVLEALAQTQEPRFIMGHVFRYAQPVRNRHSKWSVAVNEFNGQYYPPYCSGTAYAFTTSVARDLLKAANENRLFWLEDVYITGMCARTAKIPHVHYKEFWFLKRRATGCEYRKALSGHEVTPIQMYKIFSELNDDTIVCDNK